MNVREMVLRDRLGEAQQRIRALEAERDSAREENARLHDDVARLPELEAELEDIQRSDSAWQALCEKVEAELAVAREGIANREHAKEELARRLAAAREELRRSRLRFRSVEEQLAMLLEDDSLHHYGDECYEFVDENPPDMGP